jgi:hypothetical protein
MSFSNALFFSFIAVFLATAWITIAGLIGKLPVPDKYLKILVGALLVEVALALVFQFKTLDVTTLPQQLEKEIMAVQMPLKQPGATITVRDKLQRLIEVYQSQATSEAQLASCKNQLAVATKQLEAHDLYNAKLRSVFRDPQAVSNISSAVEEIFANQDLRPLLDLALAKHDWYDLNRPDFVEKFWKKITPDHPVSEALIALKKNRLGPFASTDAAVFVSVPVPSSIHKGEAIVRAGSSFEANWIRLSNDDLQSPIWVHATHLHDRDPILEKTTGLKHELIQLNLEDAKSLFGKARFAGPLQLAQASF